jgi:hypothetical protein
VSRGRLPPARGVVLLLSLAGLLLAAACGRPVDGVPAATSESTSRVSAEDLGQLIVTDVPSGLPRLSDEDLTPPAGSKRVEDIAGYARDPARERAVLEDYGYRHGWERFWGAGSGPVTGVFVDRFDSRAGAGAYAEDLARNDAEEYGGMLSEKPDPRQLHGPAGFAWCVHGVFSVSATAVTDSVDAAEAEVHAVLTAQLDRLPPR